MKVRNHFMAEIIARLSVRREWGLPAERMAQGRSARCMVPSTAENQAVELDLGLPIPRTREKPYSYLARNNSLFHELLNQMGYAPRMQSNLVIRVLGALTHESRLAVFACLSSRAPTGCRRARSHSNPTWHLRAYRFI